MTPLYQNFSPMKAQVSEYKFENMYNNAKKVHLLTKY